MSGRAALWGPAAVCAGGRRPAREIATREPAARSGRSRGPPWPCRRPPAPWPCPPVPPAPSTPVGPGHCSAALRVVSKPGQALPPPTGTAARPAGALHTGGAWSLFSGSVRRLDARPGPATAHRHRGRSLRRPPHQWCLVAVFWFGASSRCLARSRHRPRAPQPGPPVPSNPSNRSALGRESPKTQTTSVKMGEFGVFWARWSVFWAHGGYE